MTHHDNEPDDFIDRRRERVYRGVQRARDSKIPTWVYAAILAVLIAAWIYWIAIG